LFLCEPYVNAQLVKGSIKTIVVLPKYVDANEWLALNGAVLTSAEVAETLSDLL